MAKIETKFWKGKRVLITGHSGFKGSWLSKVLIQKKARVFGLSLKPKLKRNLYYDLNLSKDIDEIFVNILNKRKYDDFVNKVNPDIIFHLAAQPLVIDSIIEPELTFKTNILGTYNILDNFKSNRNSKVCIIVTSDKCYENNKMNEKFNENSKLGGDDPYSSSKACAELIINSFRKTFIENKFNKKLSSVRAGNVIGGGDWGNYRIIPDLMYSIFENKKIKIRNKKSLRPWQHVLDCINGYLILAEKMYHSNNFNGPWNFGPKIRKEITVENLIEDTHKFFNIPINRDKIEFGINVHNEVKKLSLNAKKSNTQLNWFPKMNYNTALRSTLDWYKNFYNKSNMEKYSIKQIKDYYSI